MTGDDEKKKSLDLAIQIKDLRFSANIFEGMNRKDIEWRKIDTQIPKYQKMNIN